MIVDTLPGEVMLVKWINSDLSLLLSKGERRPCQGGGPIH